MSLHHVNFFVEGERIGHEVTCTGADDECSQAAFYHYGDPTKCAVLEQINNVTWDEAVDPDLQRPHRIPIRQPIELGFRVEIDGDNYTVFVTPRVS